MVECAAQHSTSDAVIVVLVPHHLSTRGQSTRGRQDSGSKWMSDWKCARRMLSSLRLLQDDGRADVRIFHDRADATPTSALLELIGSVRGPRRACTVEYDLAGNHTPLGVRRSSWKSPLRRRPSEWGYNHMIRFFFADLFLDGVLPAHYRYWLRIDSDAMFRQPVANPFPALDASPDVDYLHNEPTIDCGDVARGLPAFADAWAARSTDRSSSWHGREAARRARPELDGDTAQPEDSQEDCVLGWFNNIEVGRLSAFRTAGMAAFRRAVLSSGGIYSHRWGDALLRRLSLEFNGVGILALPRNLTGGYYHGCGRVRRIA